MKETYRYYLEIVNKEIIANFLLAAHKNLVNFR